MTIEKLLGRERDNSFERKRLISAIAARTPACLFLMGDMVALGHDAKDWLEFDDDMHPIRDNAIPVFPVVGNHDYFYNKSTALSHMRERFSVLGETTYYLQQMGGLACVLLDSNLKGAAWSAQCSWFQAQLLTLEADPQVSGIIVFTHHPPYTNSFVVGSDTRAQKEIVPLFLEHSKTLLFISGHCHSYERFECNNKTFIVSGGGGGARQRLRQGLLAKHHDLFVGPSIRPFHYLWIEPSTSHLSIDVMGLNRGDRELFKMETVCLPYQHR